MKIHRRLTPIAVAVWLAACGGSSSDPAPAAATPATASGRAVDGYLRGAAVTCDVNANGLADAGEAATTTSATGAYSVACDQGLVLTGGTNVDTGLPFQGKLRSPAGSTVITPLTNLVVLGLSSAKVAEVLGLPAGTDVTQLDPALQTNGVYTNQAVFQKTLALQQLIQQTSEVIFAASVGGTATVAVSQAQYDAVARAVTAALSSVTSAAPLMTSSGTVSSGLVSTLIAAAVEAVKTSTDPTLATLKTAAAALDATRVASFATTSLTTQLTILVTATGDGLSAAARNAQNDPVLTAVSDSLRTSGAFASTSTVDMIAVATATNTAVVNGVVDSFTVSALSTAGVTAPPAVTTVTNYFAITDDTITLGSSSPTSHTLAQLQSGITRMGPSSSNDDLFNLSFGLTTVGEPLSGVTTAELGFELVGTGSDPRLFRFIIDKVDLSVVAGLVVASVPADAVLTVYARKSDGVSEVEVALTNLGANVFSTSSGTIIFNAGAVVTKILAQGNSQTSSFFTALLDSIGVFNLKGVLSSNVPVRTSEKYLLPTASVTIGGKSVGGPSVQGTVTVN